MHHHTPPIDAGRCILYRGHMEHTRVNFRCPSDAVEILDKMAADDHRDRASLLNKIVATYIKENYQPNGSPTTTAPQRKKAGTR